MSRDRIVDLNSTCAIMDKLKAEILSKRKVRAETDARPAKYMRRGDLEKLKEAEKGRTRTPSESRSLVMQVIILIAGCQLMQVISTLSRPLRLLRLVQKALWTLKLMRTHHRLQCWVAKRMGSIYRTRKRSDVYGRKDSLSVYSTSLTVIVDCVCVRLNCSRSEVVTKKVPA